MTAGQARCEGNYGLLQWAAPVDCSSGLLQWTAPVLGLRATTTTAAIPVPVAMSVPVPCAQCQCQSHLCQRSQFPSAFSVSAPQSNCNPSHPWSHPSIHPSHPIPFHPRLASVITAMLHCIRTTHSTGVRLVMMDISRTDYIARQICSHPGYTEYPIRVQSSRRV